MRQSLSLTGQLLDVLGESIVLGVFKDARFPTEKELADQHQAGRACVREAVKMLVAKGMLYARSGQGTFVSPESAWSVFDPDILRWMLARRFSLLTLVQLTQVRLGAEPAAAALAASRMTTATRQALGGDLEGIYAAARGEGDVLATQIAFHRRVLSATQNPLYCSLESLVTTGLAIAAAFAYRRRKPIDLSGYRSLGDAILHGRIEAASLAMHTMITEIMRQVSDYEDEARRPETTRSVGPGVLRPRRVTIAKSTIAVTRAVG